MAETGVTVAVPTLNRGSFLFGCLRDLLAQDHRPLEILVVDQSAETPAEVARLVAGHSDIVSYHKVGFRGLPEARNYAWRKARYEAIIYVDDDIRCGQRLASEHLRALSIPGVGVVAGGIDEANKPPDMAPTGRFCRWTGAPSAGFGAHGEMFVEHAKGANFSAWRSVIEKVGGFDEALNVGAALYEELEFCLRVSRAGWKIYFNGAARLTHLAAPSGGCRVEDVPRYVRALAHNRGILIRRHISLPLSLIHISE
ncbi:MAG: glycosyltransferase, partial [Planctomycetota bacterium]|nr:glycosyltransferase [Planctomycetota bacterium]